MLINQITFDIDACERLGLNRQQVWDFAYAIYIGDLNKLKQVFENFTPEQQQGVINLPIDYFKLDSNAMMDWGLKNRHLPYQELQEGM